MKKLSLNALKSLGAAQQLSDADLSQVKGGHDCYAFCKAEQDGCNQCGIPPAMCQNLFDLCMAHDACH
ncbi:MAG: hypothetical protein AAF682_28255 [Planctomycetota bacterium]